MRYDRYFTTSQMLDVCAEGGHTRAVEVKLHNFRYIPLGGDQLTIARFRCSLTSTALVCPPSAQTSNVWEVVVVGIYWCSPSKISIISPRTFSYFSITPNGTCALIIIN